MTLPAVPASPRPDPNPAAGRDAGGFDFDFAVRAPFRMQPGLRRAPQGDAGLTPVQPGSRHQREKLAVLSAFSDQALVCAEGFDTTPALHGLMRHAAQALPAAWAWDGVRAEARQIGAAVDLSGRIKRLAPGAFGLGDEVTRCLQGLPPSWRLAGLIALAFEEDLAIVDAARGTLPWMAVCLPSFWAPREKVGRHFTDVHGEVADNERLLAASDSLMQLVGGPHRWERFVWTVTPHPRLHAHPARVDPRRWDITPVQAAWWRTEHQSFLPLPAATGAQAVFTIRIAVQPLEHAVRTPERARALLDALQSQSEAVRRYRRLDAVASDLLKWLAKRAAPTLGPPGG